MRANSVPMRIARCHRFKIRARNQMHQRAFPRKIIPEECRFYSISDILKHNLAWSQLVIQTCILSIVLCCYEETNACPKKYTKNNFNDTQETTFSDTCSTEYRPLDNV